MYYMFELSSQRRVMEANYNTFVNPLLHPNRVMQQHDFLYILDGKWEIALEKERQCEIFSVQKGDLIILPALLHHYGTQPGSPNSRNMYIHAEALAGDCPVHAKETSGVRAWKLSCLFDLLLCGLGELDTAVPVPSQCAAFVNAIAQYLRSNPELFFSVSEIAQKFYVSEKTLNKRFKIMYTTLQLLKQMINENGLYFKYICLYCFMFEI